jgi:uncharacterized protein YidB (DUF937 family)
MPHFIVWAEWIDSASLGPNIIKTLAERAGMSEEELLRQLSQALPGVVDKLTPNGRLPTPTEVNQWR